MMESDRYKLPADSLFYAARTIKSLDVFMRASPFFSTLQTCASVICWRLFSKQAAENKLFLFSLNRYTATWPAFPCTYKVPIETCWSVMENASAVFKDISLWEHSGVRGLDLGSLMCVWARQCPTLASLCKTLGKEWAQLWMQMKRTCTEQNRLPGTESLWLL